jgi:hypothetical protein
LTSILIPYPSSGSPESSKSGSSPRKRLNHGEWLPWLKENVLFSDRTATNYMRAYDWRHLLKSATISDLNLTRALSFLAQPKRYKLPPPSPLHGKSPVRTEPERARIFQESSLTEEPDSTVIEADSIQPLLINGIITLKNGLRNPLRIQSTICSSASGTDFPPISEFTMARRKDVLRSNITETMISTASFYY